MTKWILLVVFMVTIVTPAWSLDLNYNGSVDPRDQGWTMYEGNLFQGSVFDEGGGNSSWYLNDISTQKTKIRYGTGVEVNPDTGAYIESRIKCTSWSDGSTNPGQYPLNLSLYIYRATDDHQAAHSLTVRPDRLYMNNALSSPNVITGDFTAYHTYRLVYKYLNLPVQSKRTHAWAVYMDGAEVPVLHSFDNVSPKPWGGPAWGAGNTSNVQNIYFDYVNYSDTGAYPPGMDGTVLFVEGDPDAAPTPALNGFTVTWKTNVPSVGTIHYSAIGNNSFSNTFADPDTALKTTHSVTVTATPGKNYEFYVVSADAAGKKAISLPSTVSLPNPFYIFEGPAYASSEDMTSVNITWTTSLPDATSELHYGTDASCSTVVVEPGGGGVTNHSITVPAVIGTKYFYFVKSTHAEWPSVQSTVQNFYLIAPTLVNPGFEEGNLDPWVKINPFDGVFNFGDWAVPSYAGAKWAGSVASYDTKDNGGLYQKVVTTPGNFYEAAVWIWCRRTSTHPGDDACRIGIDPSGGSDINASTINWSDWTETATSTIGSGGPWTQISTAAKAAGNKATVFLQQRQRFAVVWNITGFDNASWGSAPAPPPGIGATRKLKNGYPASLQGKVVTGYYSQLETGQTFFYVEETDRSAGIKVVSDAYVTPGDLVNVSGTVRTVNNEKVIVADAVDSSTPPNPTVPAPLEVTNKSIKASFDKLSADCQGLRVKTTGKVTYIVGNMMYIDDGSNVADGFGRTEWGAADAKGIRVYCDPSQTKVGDHVAVIGCAGTTLFTPPDLTPPVDPFALPVIWCSEYRVVSQ